jgi:hypothetical protein
MLLLFSAEYLDMCLQLKAPIALDRKIICSQLIGHNPLGSDEMDRNERFQRTVDLYGRVFHQPAPAVFWKKIDVKD